MEQSRVNKQARGQASGLASGQSGGRAGRRAGNVVAALVLAAGLVGAAAVATRPATAQNGATAMPPARIGTVDIEKVLQNLNEFAQVNVNSKNKNQARQVQVDELTKGIEGIEGKLNVMKKDDPARRDLLVQRAEMEVQRRARLEGMQRMINLENGEALRGIYRKVMAEAQILAQKQGLEMVLMDDRAIDVPEFATEGEVNAIIQVKRVLWAAPTLDVTTALVSQMNANFAAGVDPVAQVEPVKPAPAAEKPAAKSKGKS